jgi:hypothetical protein
VDAGRALRVRNPVMDQTLVIKAPSLGYRDMALSFATMRTSSGASLQQVSYALDAAQTTWTQLEPAYMVTGNYLVHQFSLDGVAGANDNPHLAFRVDFLGPEVEFNTGNNRFDNVTVSGRPYSLVEQEFCEGDVFTYNGITYDQPGRHVHEFSGPMDCGTHVLLRLAYPPIDTTVLWMPGGAVVAPGADHYQWLDCDDNMSPVPGAGSNEFQPTDTGNYAVRITVNGCTVLSNCHIIDPDQVTGITVFPNPVSDMLHVAGINGHVDAPYALYDNSGRMVLAGRLSGSPGMIDMRRFAHGIYTLEIRDREILRYRIVR